MASKMFENFGLPPESNTLDDFVATAKAIEQRGKTKTYYEAMKRNMQSNTSTTRATPKPAPPFCQPTAVHNVGQHSAPMKLPRFSRPSPRTTINKAKPVGQNDPHAAITRNRVGISRKCIPHEDRQWWRTPASTAERRATSPTVVPTHRDQRGTSYEQLAQP